MADPSFVESALVELLMVSIVLGGPILLAVFWERHNRSKQRKYNKKTIDLAAQQGYIERRHRNPPNHVTIVPTQASKDAKIFKTVEEYRNESD